LLVVGDGCTDRTAEVVAQFEDARIRWFDLPKAPLSGYANRNIALRQARGHYIAYAQHDDIFFPDHLSQLAATAERAHAQWCYSRPLWVEPDGLIAPFAVDLTRPEELAEFRRRNLIPSCCVLHTRSILEQVGFWPEGVARIAD
jgi:glycosyltransferase involved in cell wall biosynthesis